MARLGERVGDRGPAVAHRVGQGRAAVEVSERGVVDAVEELDGHDGDAAHGDVALALAGQPAGDERVRQHHRAGARRAGREVGADAAPSRRPRAAWCERVGSSQAPVSTSGSR